MTDYPSGQVAKGAGRKTADINLWVARGYTRPDVDSDDKSNRRWQFESAVEIAVAAKLNDGGLTVPAAFEAAKRFSQSGTGGSGWELGGGKKAPKRLPARPFDKGETYLVVGETVTHVACVRNADDLAEAIHAFGQQIPTLLNVGNIYWQVVGALGGDPQRPRETSRA